MSSQNLKVAKIVDSLVDILSLDAGSFFSLEIIPLGSSSIALVISVATEGQGEILFKG